MKLLIVFLYGKINDESKTTYHRTDIPVVVLDCYTIKMAADARFCLSVQAE